MSAGPLRPVLLSVEEIASLTRLLEYTDRFDHAGLGADARTLLALLTNEDRTGNEEGWSYSILGPWGSHAAESEEHAVAEVRAARAEHWAEGWGRDERYHQIQAVRRLHVYFDDGDGQFQIEEVIEVPDAPLTEVEEAESQRRIDAADRRREALYAHLRDLRPSDEPA